MATPTLTAATFRVRFRNSSDREMNLWIEPLGDRVAISRGTTIECHCTDQLGYPNEIDVSDEGITIHGWVQRVAAMSDNGGSQSLWALPDE